MKQLINKTAWTICMLFIMQSYLINTLAQTPLMDDINSIPYSLPPLENGVDVANWKYTSSCFVQDFPNKIVGRLYDDLQCTKFVIYKKEFEDLIPDVYLKMKLPNSTDLLSALAFGGNTDYDTEVIFTIDTQGNVKDTLEVRISNSYMKVKEYHITADYKIVISRLKITTTKPLLLTELLPDSLTFTGYREDLYYYIDDKSHFVLEKTNKFPEKTYTIEQIKRLHTWEL